jgi:O-antigen ligase/Tfp pilus assembly protein PilF
MGGVFYLTHLILLYFYIVVLSKLEFSLLKILVYSNIAIATVLSVYAIFVRLGMNPWVPDPSLPRVSATFGNPIFFPSYLIPIMFLTIFWGTRKKGFGSFWFYFLAFLQLIATFLSGTRGAVVGLILGVFISLIAYVALGASKKLRAYGAAAIFLLIALGSGLYLNSDKLPQGSMLRRVFALRDSNTQARLIQWRVALTGFKDYPILGTGSENYYVTGNKYYNPEIYKYDASWFDKPHNYILEVLVTNGILGFISYLSIIFLCAVSFYKSYKLGALGLLSSACLLAGLLVYQIQNLFVFDTVSASMSFFIFVSFAAFLWEKILSPEDNRKKIKQSLLNTWQPGNGFALGSFFVALVFSVYVVWAGNIMPIRASADTNYGYAYGGVDPQKAENFFQNAVNNPFNFDKTETASKYQEFAAGILRNPGKTNPQLVESIGQHAKEALLSVSKQNPNNPIIWQKLASLSLTYAYLRQGSIEPGVMDSLKKAIELAPRRTEAMSALFQLEMVKGNVNEALKIAKQMSELNPTNLEIKWQLSIVQKEVNLEEAIKISESLLDSNFQFPNPDSLKWLLEYYYKKGNAERMIQIGELLIKQDPNNKDAYLQMVQIYLAAGQKQKAQELAAKLVEVEPSFKEKLQNILSK